MTETGAAGAPIRGIDHVGLTVPDAAAAGRFLEVAFGARLIFEVHGPPAASLEVPPTDRPIASPGGALIRVIRMYELGRGPGVELFEYRAPEQRPAAFTSDLGWQHVALYVDDLEAAAASARAAGGDVLNAPWDLMGEEAGPGARILFVRAPFGALFELITYPEPLRYERSTSLRRWKPATA